MNKLQTCKVNNCIPTPSECIEWNGGDVEFLNICNGEPLNNLMWQIINKLQDIAGQDLSGFDMDGLLDICNQKAPQEVTIISILNVVKQNQVCLKDYVNTLSEQLADILNESKVKINLKCYQDFDNLGNALAITRDELDQLVINELCTQKAKIETLEGKVTNLQTQFDNFDPKVDEPEFKTCVDSVEKPTSSQVKSVATAHCNLDQFVKTEIGNSGDISTGISKLTDPNINWDVIFAGNPDWIALTTGLNLAEGTGALAVIVKELWKKVKFMEENCCAITCDDIEIGFTASLNNTGDGIIIKFTWGAGTKIPQGVVDKGSKGKITDIYGNVETFNLAISNNGTVEVPLDTLSLDGDLEIDIEAVMGTDTLVCTKCIDKKIKISNTKCCEVTNTSNEKVTIIYYTK